uniref:Cyclic nucleotide-binding domain-containing protein n=1 Tax=Alexandrium catenella TaxID=2925 RepID=A0A7S1Q4G5_ALECA
MYHYFTAFHWSITQFTPASMEVVPRNAAERLFTILTISLGLVVFSSFVSNMTHAMTSFQRLTSEQAKKNQNLRQFLSTHRVSMALVHRIIYFCKSSNSSGVKKRLHEVDVSCLKALPENLLMRLHQEVYADTLACHPLFQKLRDIEDVCFLNICNVAMSERSLTSSEELFRCGTPASTMYFVVAGSLNYFRGYDMTMASMVETDRWICECSLWAKWEHRGRLTSWSEVSELMCLDAHEFHRVVAQTRSVLEVKRYAQLFCTRAVLDCGSADEITDLYGGRTTVDAIARRAFNHGDDAHLINKAVMLWSGKDAVLNVFKGWKQITASAKLNRGRRGSMRRASHEAEEEPPAAQ